MRREWWPALFLFLFAMAVFFAREWGRAREATTLGAAALFAVLTGLTLALSVTAVRDRLRTRSQAVNVLAAPLAITAAIALCCAVIGAPRHARWCGLWICVSGDPANHGERGHTCTRGLDLGAAASRLIQAPDGVRCRADTSLSTDFKNLAAARLVVTPRARI